VQFDRSFFDDSIALLLLVKIHLTHYKTGSTLETAYYLLSSYSPGCVKQRSRHVTGTLITQFRTSVSSPYARSKPVWWLTTTNWLLGRILTLSFHTLSKRAIRLPSTTYAPSSLDALKVNRSQGLNVKARVISTESLPWYNVGFALLLMNSQVAEILFAFVRTHRT